MLKRFKKFGLPAVALAAMLVLLTPPHADARVRIGVSIGAPVYTYPVNPYANSYQYPPIAPAPNYYGYGYPAPVYQAPAYVAPYTSFGFAWGGHDRDNHDRLRVEHRIREHHEGHRH